MRGDELSSLVEVIEVCDDFLLCGVRVIECNGVIVCLSLFEIFDVFHGLTLVLTM